MYATGPNTGEVPEMRGTFLTVAIIAFFILLGVSAVLSTSAEAGHDQAIADQDGEGIYREHCATCHDRGVPRAPTRAALSRMPTDNIRFALTSGKMSTQGAELNRAQLESLLRFLTGSVAVTSGSTRANPCEGNGALSAEAESLPRWSGWGAGPAQQRYQPPDVAGLPADQVPRLKLKWAFCFPGGTRAY